MTVRTKAKCGECGRRIVWTGWQWEHVGASGRPAGPVGTTPEGEGLVRAHLARPAKPDDD